MKPLTLYQEVDVTVKEVTSTAHRQHTHPFFEMIYVLEGSGIHVINANHYGFSEGDLFLLTPDDGHAFEVESPVRFCIIDFTASFFSRNEYNREEKMEVGDFFKRLEYVFHNHHSVQGNFMADADRPLVGMLIEQLIRERERAAIYGKVIVQNIVFLLLHLIARNIQHTISMHARVNNPKSKVHEIMAYIQHSIYDKQGIKLETIADHFNRSAGHLNRYFKAQTGHTIKDYILRYKLELIRTRLRFSDLTISEIADEMEFTDESHLNKLFRKRFGMTATQYRNSFGK